jgi:hypothetical protein
MKNLLVSFPDVKCLEIVEGQNAQLVLEPYLEWRLLAMDDWLNILLIQPQHTHEQTSSPHLLILQGELSTMWLRQQRQTKR